jgi:hypothetical protein
MKTIQQRAPADFTSAIHRDHTLKHVVLAEINFFQKEKVNDLNVYLRTLVDEQIQFYEKVNFLFNRLFYIRFFLVFIDHVGIT